jgi:tetratricopeptide (TPR) repeat protein
MLKGEKIPNKPKELELDIKTEEINTQNQAELLFYQGQNYLDNQEYDKALEYYRESLNIARELKSDKLDIAIVLSALGDVYKEKMNFQRALDCFNESFEIYNRFCEPDHPDVSKCLCNIGNCYYETMDYVRALKCMYQALDNPKTLLINRDSPFMAQRLAQIGLVYEQTSKYDLALGYLGEAIEINR